MMPLLHADNADPSGVSQATHGINFSDSHHPFLGMDPYQLPEYFGTEVRCREVAFSMNSRAEIRARNNLQQFSTKNVTSQKLGDGRS